MLNQFIPFLLSIFLLATSISSIASQGFECQNVDNELSSCTCACEEGWTLYPLRTTITPYFMCEKVGEGTMLHFYGPVGYPKGNLPFGEDLASHCSTTAPRGFGASHALEKQSKVGKEWHS